MSKTREEKIKSVAVELRVILSDFKKLTGEPYLEPFAARLLDAAERETPRWPTDESVEAMDDIINDPRVVNHEKKREALRAAMSADPIVVAARYAISELRSCGRIESETMATLEDAVSEAGLL